MPVDPRSISNEEQGFLALPFNIKSTAGVYALSDSNIGKPVSLSANNEISDGADGDVFLGKLIAVSADGAVGTVQVSGVCVNLPYSGTAPVIGWPVQMSGSGTVDKGVTDGVCRGFTLSVNITAQTCDVLL